MSGHVSVTLFDHMVWTLHRQIYAGPPHVPDDLPPAIAEQRKLKPAVVEIVVPDDARPLNLHKALPRLSGPDLKRFEEVMESDVRQDTDGRVRVDNHVLLKLDTLVEIKGHGVVTVEEFKTSDAFDFSDDESDSGKYRCQCIYRASDSWNGILRKFPDGRVMHHDNGAGITYWLDDVQAEFEDLTANSGFVTPTPRQGSETASGFNLSKSLEDFTRRFVYITESDQVFDLDETNAAYAVLPRTNFMVAHAPAKRVVVGANNQPKRIALAKEWLESPKRKTVQGLRYSPDRGPGVFEEDGLFWVNSFHMPSWDAESEPNPEAVFSFLEHIRMIVAGEAEQSLAINWLAHLLQFPGQRQRFALLMLARQQGTGRGWVIELMKRLLGQWNVKPISMKEFDSDFDDAFIECLLNVIEEVRETGQERFAFGENLKERITAQTTVANKKYGPKRLERLHSSLLLQSNHPDAIVISSEDRRILSVATDADPKPDDYYSQLYSSLDEPDFVRSVAAYLLQRDLAEYRRLLRAPMTSSKERMMDLTRSPADHLVEAFLSECPADYFTANQVAKYGEHLQHRGVLHECPAQNALNAVLIQRAERPTGLPDCGIKVRGGPVRPWQRIGFKPPDSVPLRELIRKEIMATYEWLTNIDSQLLTRGEYADDFV